MITEQESTKSESINLSVSRLCLSNSSNDSNIL